MYLVSSLCLPPTLIRSLPPPRPCQSRAFCRKLSTASQPLAWESLVAGVAQATATVMDIDNLESLDDIFSGVLSGNWALPPPLEGPHDFTVAADHGPEAQLPGREGAGAGAGEPQPASDCRVDDMWTVAMAAVDAALSKIPALAAPAPAAVAAAVAAPAPAPAATLVPPPEDPPAHEVDLCTMLGYAEGDWSDGTLNQELGVGDWTVPEICGAMDRFELSWKLWNMSSPPRSSAEPSGSAGATGTAAEAPSEDASRMCGLLHFLQRIGYDEDGLDVEGGHCAGAGPAGAEAAPAPGEAAAAPVVPAPVAPPDGHGSLLPLPLRSRNSGIHHLPPAQQQPGSSVQRTLWASERRQADAEFERALSMGLIAPPRRWTDEERAMRPPELVDTRRCLDLQPGERETLRRRAGDAAESPECDVPNLEEMLTHPEAHAPAAARSGPTLRPRPKRPSRAARPRAAKAKAAQEANQIKATAPVKEVKLKLKLKVREAVEDTRDGDQATLTPRLQMDQENNTHVKATEGHVPNAVPVPVVQKPPARPILPRPAESLEDQLRRMTAPSRQLRCSKRKSKELQVWNRNMDHAENLRAAGVENSNAAKRTRADAVGCTASGSPVQLHHGVQAQRARPANTNPQPDPQQRELQGGNPVRVPVTFFGWSPVNRSAGAGAGYNMQQGAPAAAEGGANSVFPSACGSGVGPDLIPDVGFMTHEFNVVESSRPDYVIACDSGSGWTYNAVMPSGRASSSVGPINSHGHDERVAGYSISGPLFPFALIDLQPGAGLSLPLPVLPSSPAQPDNALVQQHPPSPHGFTGSLMAEESDQDSTERGANLSLDTIMEEANSAGPADPEVAGHSPGADGTSASADGRRTFRGTTIYWPRYGK